MGTKHYLTIFRARDVKLTHFLIFSEALLARSFLKSFGFELENEDLKGSFWINFSSKLVASLSREEIEK